MKTSAILVTASLAAASLLPLRAAAAATTEVETGRQRIYTCTGCHGIPGYRNAYPNYPVPRIAGQNREYLIASLTAYANGDRLHPTMRAQAESFTVEEIEAIATYLSAALEHDAVGGAP